MRFTPSPDPLAEIDISTVKTRSITGVTTLIGRSFIKNIISFVGFFFLTVFLGRPDIGLFTAVNEMVAILGYFSDIGLAASLVQKRDKVSVEDLRTTFTIQQVLVVGLIILFLIFSAPIRSYFNIPDSGVFLMVSLLVGFFLASLKTIPSVILERQLRFELFVLVELAETLLYYGVAILLAWKGFGVISYAVAVVVRGLVGTVLLYYLCPWPVGFAFSKQSLKSLLSFGLPYQINSFIAVVKDRFIVLAQWKIIGADGVGIIGWANNLAQYPLRFIMDNVTKVTFPSFSRLQDHPDKLKSAIEKTLYFITFLTFPILGGLALTAPYVVALVPKYSKWEVALFPLILFCINSAWACVSTPLTNTLNAIGKVKYNTYLTIMWTVLTWALVPLLAFRMGYVGVAWASAIISFTSVIPIILVKRLTHFSLTKSILKPFVATSFMVVITWLLTLLLPKDIYFLIVIIIVSAAVYFLINLLLIGRTLIDDTRQLVYAFLGKK